MPITFVNKDLHISRKTTEQHKTRREREPLVPESNSIHLKSSYRTSQSM